MKSSVLHITTLILAVFLLRGIPLQAQESEPAKKEKPYQEFSLEIKNDYRYYFNEGLYEGQRQNYLSVAVEPEYYLDWNDGKHSLRFTGFFRYDNRDSRRTHGDIRELYYQWVKDNWEVVPE